MDRVQQQPSRLRAASSTLAIGAATAFLLLATLAAFLADDKVAVGTAGWSLRGTIQPGFDQPAAKRA